MFFTIFNKVYYWCIVRFVAWFEAIRSEQASAVIDDMIKFCLLENYECQPFSIEPIYRNGNWEVISHIKVFCRGTKAHKLDMQAKMLKLSRGFPVKVWIPSDEENQ